MYILWLAKRYLILNTHFDITWNHLCVIFWYRYWKSSLTSLILLLLLIFPCRIPRPKLLQLQSPPPRQSIHNPWHRVLVQPQDKFLDVALCQQSLIHWRKQRDNHKLLWKLRSYLSYFWNTTHQHFRQIRGRFRWIHQTVFRFFNNLEIYWPREKKYKNKLMSKRGNKNEELTEKMFESLYCQVQRCKNLRSNGSTNNNCP